jgi:hypothetical protein
LPNSFGNFRQRRPDQRVEQRRQHHEDRGAAFLADELVAAGELEHQHGDGEARQALEDGGERKTFEPVQLAGFRRGNSVHGGVPWRGTMPPI